jgi:hypothetical protein
VKIPKKAVDRQEYYQEILQACCASQQGRREFYKVCKSYYLYGSDGSQDSSEGRWNKIQPHIEQLCSFMYSQETTRFNIEVGPAVSDLERRKVPSLNKAVQQEWNSSNGDIIFGQALLWAFDFGSMFIKSRWKKDGIQKFVVEPHMMGVYREDVMGLENQEAVSHSYFITETQLRNELQSAAKPDKEINRLIDNAQAARRDTLASSVGAVDRLIISSVSPNILGNTALWNSDLSNMYKPRVAQPLIKMHELYVFDDDSGEFQVVTLMDPGEVVWDRPSKAIFLPDELPFVQLCPNPAYDYFWGYSEVERLIPLQQMRNDRMRGIVHLMRLQERPPKSGAGYSGIMDEIALAMDSPAGLTLEDNPAAKLDVHSPTIPDDLFAEIREIDGMFEEVSGINNVMQGKGESGVRSQGHASQLAKLGSARAKRKALMTEDALEKQATLDVKIMKVYDARRYRAEDFDDKPGGEFVAHQFTDDFICKVDAHSSSPIFQDDQEQKAFELFKAKAIDRESLLENVEIPKRDLLIDRLKNKIEPAEARAAQQQLALEVGKEANKHKPKEKGP